jgi:hypothetical protein
MAMSADTSSTPATSQLWGIYFTDREYARTVEDPLRTVIEAPSKRLAEEIAKRYGFSEPWAHPITEEQAMQMRASEPHAKVKHGLPSQTLSANDPTATEVNAAIEVLQKLDERIAAQTNHSLGELPNNRLGNQYADRIESDAIEQTARIKLVSAQLANWRDELLQQRNTVSHHV